MYPDDLCIVIEMLVNNTVLKVSATSASVVSLEYACLYLATQASTK